LSPDGQNGGGRGRPRILPCGTLHVRRGAAGVVRARSAGAGHARTPQPAVIRVVAAPWPARYHQLFAALHHRPEFCPQGNASLLRNSCTLCASKPVMQLIASLFVQQRAPEDLWYNTLDIKVPLTAISKCAPCYPVGLFSQDFGWVLTRMAANRCTFAEWNRRRSL